MSKFFMVLSLILVIYGAGNFYVFIKGWRLLPTSSVARIPYLIIFLIGTFAYIIGMALRSHAPCFVCNTLTWIGSIWIGILVYLLLFTLLVSLLAFLLNLFGLLPSAFHLLIFRRISAGVLLLIVVALFLVGFSNARNPQVTTVRLKIPGKQTSVKSLSIAAASDLHIGTLIHGHRVEQLVSIMNSLKPDIVVLVGDIIDGDIEPVQEMEMTAPLKELKAPLGVYGITGNHEFISGIDRAVETIRNDGVTLLRDEWLLIQNAFYLVGRDDRSGTHFKHQPRKQLPEVMTGINSEYPIILLDHQPFHLQEAADAGVDLQLSGHTHHGQLFPFNYITQMIYEQSWGYLKKLNTHYYVSCGFGTWGPPIRIGNRAEVVHILIEFIDSEIEKPSGNS